MGRFIRTAKHRADGFNLLGVTNGRGRAVGVDVIDLAFNGGKRLAHAADRALAGRGHHIITVRCCAVADNLAVDLGAPGFRVLQLFQHKRSRAPRDHKAIAVDVIGAGGGRRGAVVLG